MEVLTRGGPTCWGMDAGGPVEAIVRCVRTFASGTPQADDITALVIAHSGGEPPPSGP